ncbi:hypothetical protein LX69_01361 [Breznakibacter xylanolyticus]|uniref:Uncharacterized protein n=1 Tax=Breznakibacter xylanolyticus TaxID=990 RepID=A0A2W7NBX1_9BACT|nr:DUF6266 family protein [Breznakibacter xylanolyticus]MBN2743427.1 hypothetical protein [Marinilabiliaceae bacterium]PZX17945.1 hypothetical protein LX69_01361 [Breznakibacter xylanolyticus]
MGKFYKGILGGFSGKVGTVIGSRWKGLEYMRSKSAPRRGGFSLKQLEQQARFGLAVRFLQPLQPALAIGYRAAVRHSTFMNKAVSDLLQYAIEGDYPDYQVAPALVRIAQGPLQAPSGCNVAVQGGRVVVTWTAPTGQLRGSEHDGVLLVALTPGGVPCFDLLTATRGQGTASVELPTADPGAQVYVYLAFASQSCDDVSNSVVAGVITL